MAATQIRNDKRQEALATRFSLYDAPGSTKHLRKAPHVLLVGDDWSTMRLIVEILATLGYHSSLATDSRDALQRAATVPYDLIIADLEMADLNGFLLASRIKQSSPETRAIIMTGRCHAEVLEQITSVADGWLFKPFSRDDLRRTLHGLATGPGKVQYNRRGRSARFVSGRL